MVTKMTRLMVGRRVRFGAFRWLRYSAAVGCGYLLTLSGACGAFQFIGTDLTIKETWGLETLIGYDNHIDYTFKLNPRSPTVTIVEGGRFGQGFGVLNGSTVNMKGGYASAFACQDTSTLTMTGGEVAGAAATGKSHLALSGGAILAGLRCAGDSTLTLSGTTVALDVSAFERSTLTLSGGSIGRSLVVNGESTVELTGTPIGINIDAIYGTINIVNGRIGKDVLANGSTITFSSGSIGGKLRAIGRATVTMHTGTINGPIMVHESQLNLQGGSSLGLFVEGEYAVAEVSGGTIDGDVVASGGATMALTGGEFKKGLTIADSTAVAGGVVISNDVQVTGTGKLDFYGGAIGGNLTGANAGSILMRGGALTGDASVRDAAFFSIDGAVVSNLTASNSAGLSIINSSRVVNDVTLSNNNTLFFDGGTVREIFVNGNSTAQMHDGKAFAATVSDNGFLSIEGGVFSIGLEAHDEGWVVMHGGSTRQLMANGLGFVQLNGGMVETNVSVGDRAKASVVDGKVFGDLVGSGSSTINMSGGTVCGLPIFTETSSFNYSGGVILFGKVPPPAGDAAPPDGSENEGVAPQNSVADGVAEAPVAGAPVPGITVSNGASIHIFGHNLRAMLIDPNYDGTHSQYQLDGLLADGTRVSGQFMFIQNGTGASYSLIPVPPIIGGSFQPIATEGGGAFTGITVHSSGRLYGRTAVGGLYRSDDHGQRWAYLSGSMTSESGHVVQGVAVAAGDPDTLYQCVGVQFGGPERGIWKSIDGGATWRQILEGTNFAGEGVVNWGGECIALRPGNDAEIWAGTWIDGLFRSTDGGAYWHSVGGDGFARTTINSVCLPPAGRSDIWVGTTSAGAPGGLRVSVDDGVTWTSLVGTSDGLAAPNRCWRVTREPNGRVLVAGGNDAVGTVLYEFTATDWGDPSTYSWTDISWPGIDRTQEAPLVTALADGRIVAGSLSGGTVGDPDSLRTQIRSVAGTWSATDAVAGPLPAWGSGVGTPFIEGPRNGVVQDPSDQDRWFMTGGYAPLRTTNGGISWQYAVDGISDATAFKTAFHPTDPERAYFPMAEHGGAMVSDGGAGGPASRYITTAAQPFPNDLGRCHAMLVNGDRILAFGADQRAQWRPRVYISTDNGLTWAIQPQTGLPDAADRCIISAVASRDNPDDILVALEGYDNTVPAGVFRSTDGGRSFIKTTGLPERTDYGDRWEPGADLDVDATDPNQRYLFLNNWGLFRSSDRGASWAFVESGLPYDGVISADGFAGGHLWAGICCGFSSGLSRSADGGATWTKVPEFADVMEVDAARGRIAIIGRRLGDTHAKIYYSGDDGATWGEITGPGYRFGTAHAVAVDPWRPGTVWISTTGRSVTRFTPGMPLLPDLPAPRIVGPDLVLDFRPPPEVRGFNYTVEWSSTLNPGEWSALPLSTIEANPPYSIPTSGHRQIFLRAKATSP